MANKNRFYIDLMSLHQEVTGSCILNVIKFPDGSTKKVLVDCGLFQEAEYSDLNKTLPFKAENIDYVIVTHNHVDHTGRLPLLIKQGYSGKIYTTNDTSVLLPYALLDSYKVLSSNAKLFSTPLLYSEDDVNKTIDLVQPCPYEESIWLDENIKITFFKNGHLSGAAMILMQVKYHDREYHYEDINMLFTGDYNNKNMFFDVPPLPKWVLQLPINIVQESTYGNMDSTEIVPVFEKNLLDAVSKGKEILIPVFSLGRSQEIMLILKKLQIEGKLSPEIPIYFDGKLGIKYTKLFLKGLVEINEEAQDLLPENFTFVTSKNTRTEILENSKCKILLTTSGMGSHGPAKTYIPLFLKKDNALIHFTGYCAEGTIGRKLYDTNKEDFVEIFGLKLKKKAEVEFTSEFSAHAKADELIAFLKEFKNIKFVAINHGETSSKDIYANRVANEVAAKNVGVLGEYFFRLDGYGYVKSLTTKFN